MHYANSQRPLSAANQTTSILPLPPDATTPRGGNGLGTGATNAMNTRRLPLGAINKTMSGITRSNSFNPNNAAGSVPVKGVAGKLTDEELSNKIKNRILKQNRLKPIRGGGNGTVESDEEVPIGLPPLDAGTLDLDSLPPPPTESPVSPPAQFGLGDVAGGEAPTYSRPVPVDRKSSKNKIHDLMNVNSQFPSGNVNNNPSNSQRHRNKSNKFQELRNITRQNAQLGRYNSKHERPEPPRFQYEQHINILPVKSNPAKTSLPQLMDEDAREDVRFPGDTGNYTPPATAETDVGAFHSKYHEHPEAEAEDGTQWSMKNNSGDPLKKIKWRFNMDNVS